MAHNLENIMRKHKQDLAEEQREFAAEAARQNKRITRVGIGILLALVGAIVFF